MNIWTKSLSLMCVMIAALAITVSAKAGDDLETAVQNDISYVSGGIGVEERKEMKESEKEYNVHIWNVNKIRKLTLPATLTISDASGKEILSLLNEGPIVFVTLPKGSYAVKSTYDNQEQTQKLVIKKGSSKYLTFVWDDGAQKIKHKAKKKHSVKLKTKAAEEATPAKEEKVNEEKTEKEKAKEEKLKEEKAEKENAEKEKAEKKKAKEDKLKEEKAKKEEAKKKKSDDQPYFETPEKKD